MAQEPRDEMVNDVRVIRIPTSGAMHLIPFDLLRLHLFREAAFQRAYELWDEEPFDVIHCHDLDTLPVGLRLKRVHATQVVFDAHEIWGYMVAKDLPSPLPGYYLWKEKRLLRHVDRVVTVSEPLVRYFSGLTTVPVALVMNAKPVQQTHYVPPNNPEFTLLYIGALNRTRLVEESVMAVRALEGVKLLVGGVGKPGYVKLVESRCQQVENAQFLGRVPFEDVLNRTCRADAVLALFDPDDPLTRVGLPNKAFEAMVCGRPLIASVGTYLSQFVGDHGIGIAVEPSEEGVRRGIMRLRDDPSRREALGRRALEKALTTFNWEREERALLRLYETLEN